MNGFILFALMGLAFMAGFVAGVVRCIVKIRPLGHVSKAHSPIGGHVYVDVVAHGTGPYPPPGTQVLIVKPKKS